MVDLANSGKLNQSAGRVVTTPAAMRIDQAPSLLSSSSANRPNSSVVSVATPASNSLSNQADIPTEEQLKSTVTHLNEYIQSIHRDIRFNIDDTTGRTVITVTDSETGEEIRKIPSDEMLSIAAHLGEFLDKLQEDPQIGLLFDTRI